MLELFYLNPMLNGCLFQAFNQATGAYILAPGQMGMTHVNVNNGMFVHAGPQHMMTAGGQPIASIAAGHPGQPQQQMQPGPGAVQINPPYGVQGQTRPGGPPGKTFLTVDLCDSCLNVHVQEETREDKELRTPQARLAGLTCPPLSRWRVTPSLPGACLVTSHSSWQLATRVTSLACTPATPARRPPSSGWSCLGLEDPVE